jgi:sec-independent protein translocase protein TatC
MVSMLTLANGIMFELPVVIYFLTKLGIATPDNLRKFRKYAFVILLILSGIITPPDVLSQILVCLPLYALYEVSIIISKRIYRKKKAEEAEAQKDKLRFIEGGGDGPGPEDDAPAG